MNDTSASPQNPLETINGLASVGTTLVLQPCPATTGVRRIPASPALHQSFPCQQGPREGRHDQSHDRSPHCLNLQKMVNLDNWKTGHWAR